MGSHSIVVLCTALHCHWLLSVSSVYCDWSCFIPSHSCCFFLLSVFFFIPLIKTVLCRSYSTWFIFCIMPLPGSHLYHVVSCAPPSSRVYFVPVHCSLAPCGLYFANKIFLLVPIYIYIYIYIYIIWYDMIWYVFLSRATGAQANSDL